MPVWHVSLSLHDALTRRRVGSAGQMERAAVALLAGVGGDTEWWVFSRAKVGHLRVGLTTDEYRQLPGGVAVDDAGETGPPRRRTRPRQ